jgi:hypothetical protein
MSLLLRRATGECRAADLFLGSRGSVLLELQFLLREGGHHSGNWGGALRNPAVVLAHALSCLVDAHGVIQVPGLRPPPLDERVRRALSGLTLAGEANSPAVDADWGEPGLTPLERVIGWNALEVLALESGNARKPVNAIPPSAKAVCQLRFVWDGLAQHPAAYRVALAAARAGTCAGAHSVQLRRYPAAAGPSLGRMGAGVHPSEYRPACRLCPIWAARCRMMPLPTFWACPPCGCRIPTRLCATCAQRAPAGAGGASGPGADGGHLVGSGRAG